MFNTFQFEEAKKFILGCEVEIHKILYVGGLEVPRGQRVGLGEREF